MNLFDNIAFPLIEHTKQDRQGGPEHRPAEVRARRTRQSPPQAPGRGVRAACASGPGWPGPWSSIRRSSSSTSRTRASTRSRVAYLDGLINSVHDETGATFFIISHNIESVKRTAHHLGLLFRSKLVGFGSKEEMIDFQGPGDRAVPRRSARGPDQHGRDGRRASRMRTRPDGSPPHPIEAPMPWRHWPRWPSAVPSPPAEFRRSTEDSTPTASRSTRGGRCETG